ncbi:MAG: hypothetical protein Q9213_005699 [Squamulea squamosa]
MSTTPDFALVYECEGLLGYRFQDPLILWKALQTVTPPTTNNECPPIDNGNQRLAALGIRVLNLMIAAQWYSQDMPMCKLKTASIYTTSDTDRDMPTAELIELEKDMIHDLATQIEEIGEGLLLPIPETVLHSCTSPAARNGVLHAICGAVYLDGGMDAFERIRKKTCNTGSRAGA